jgi:hypothetical protein
VKKTKSKTTKKKKVARKAARKPARKAKVTARAKTARAKTTSMKRKVTARKVRPAAKKKRATKKRASRPAVKETRSPETSTLGGATFSAGERPARRGVGSRSAGQSGDLQGLSRRALVDSESVEELVEEGQAREAAAISGVEDAPDPDEAEVRTRQVPEDDVPEEYTDED